MRWIIFLSLFLTACSPPAVTPTSVFTYDDGQGAKVHLDGKRVRVSSSHFDPVEYTLASDNVSLKLSEFNARIDGGTATTSPPSIGNGQKSVAAASIPDARVVIDQLVPKKDGVGPDGAWVGGLLDFTDLEGGTWTVTAAGIKYVLTDKPPTGFEKGATVVLVGSVATDEMSVSNAGPLYRPTDWRIWKD